MVLLDSDNNTGTGYKGVDRVAITTWESMLDGYGTVFKVRNNGDLGAQVGTFPFAIASTDEASWDYDLMGALIPQSMLSST